MRETVRRAYDEMAEAYATSSNTAWEVPFSDELAAGLKTGSRILDVGCGDGRPVSVRFQDRFAVTGVDISREQLRLASEEVPDTALVQGEMTTLPFEASTVDAVVALYSIIHVPREEHPAVFAEWARVLRPGGWVLFSSGTAAFAGRNPNWLDSGVEMVWSYPGPDETTAALEAAGFELETTAEIPDPLAEEGTKQFFLARLSDPQPINAGAGN